MKIISIISLSVFFLFSCNNSKEENNAEWIKYPDPVTGTEVWQITNHQQPSVACYFEGQAFTDDEKFMVFSSRRSGKWSLYRVDLENGSIDKITPENRVIIGDDYTIMPDGRRVCYIDGWKLYATEVLNMTEEILFDFEGKIPMKPRFSGSFTKDGKYTLAFISNEEHIAIYRINLENGEILEVHRQKDGKISHPLLNPEDPDIITYVPGPDTQNDMTLPMEERARTWKIDLKARTNKQFLTVPYGFRATHESWSWDGQRFFYFRKTRPGWEPVAICSQDQAGENKKVYYESSTIKLGHGVSSRDGKWFISDCQLPEENELVLINLSNGEGKILCYPDASIEAGHSSFAHVHPSFSPKGNYVVYTSDRTATPQVYVVPVEEIKNKMQTN